MAVEGTPAALLNGPSTLLLRKYVEIKGRTSQRCATDVMQCLNSCCAHPAQYGHMALIVGSVPLWYVKMALIWASSNGGIDPGSHERGRRCQRRPRTTCVLALAPGVHVLTCVVITLEYEYACARHGI